MGTKRWVQLKDFTAPAAGKVCTFNLPLGPRIHRIQLGLGDTAAGSTAAPAIATVVTGSRLIMGQGTQRNISLTRLDTLNTLQGAAYASQTVVGAANGGGRRYVPYFFGEPWRTRLSSGSVDLDALAIPTRWMGANAIFQLQLDVAAGITPAITASALIDDFDGDGKLPAFVKYYTDDYPAVGAAVSLSGLFKAQKIEKLIQCSAFDTSDAKTVTQARIEINSVPIIENQTFDEQTVFLKNSGMNPSAGAFHLVFDANDALEDALPVGPTGVYGSFNLSAAANGTISLVTQRLGQPDGF